MAFAMADGGDDDNDAKAMATMAMATAAATAAPLAACHAKGDAGRWRRKGGGEDGKGAAHDDDEVDEEQQTPDFADVEVKIVDSTALKPHTAQAAEEDLEQSLTSTFGVPASAEKSNDAKNTHNS